MVLNINNRSKLASGINRMLELSVPTNILRWYLTPTLECRIIFAVYERNSCQMRVPVAVYGALNAVLWRENHHLCPIWIFDSSAMGSQWRPLLKDAGNYDLWPAHITKRFNYFKQSTHSGFKEKNKKLWRVI